MALRPWEQLASERSRRHCQRDRASSRKRGYLSLRIEALESRQLLSVSNGNLEPLVTGDPDAVSADQALISADANSDSVLAPLALTGTTHVVLAGESLQAAIDAAQPGDIIELEAGATFTGNFVLPDKVGAGLITIRGSAHASLPAGRVTAADAALMPKIVTPNLDPALRAELGAHDYHLEGIEITSQANLTVDLVLLGYDGRYPLTAEEFASNITIDRSYIHGSPTGQITHAINASGADITLSNSEISDIKGDGFEAQAFVSVMGLSGYTIANNFLESSGGNIVFGGFGSDILDAFNPQNISIQGNTISKPNEWNSGHPDYAGSDWTISSLIEFNIGKHIVIEGNVLENVWANPLSGTAIVVTALEAEIDDLVIQNNVVRHAHSLLEMSPANHALSNVVFENNLAYEIENTLFSLTAPVVKQTQNVTIRNNTALFGSNALFSGLGSNNLLFGDSDASVTNLIYQDNVLGGGMYAIAGSGQDAGLASVLHYAQGFDIRGNQMLVPNQTGVETYAIGNPYDQNGDFYGDFFLWGDISSMNFADPALTDPEDFSLDGNPAFTGKGADIGAILATINAPLAQTGAIHVVLAGESLQAAIDAAQPGDIIELEAGATFTGNFILPDKVGIGWITIRGTAHASLPEGRVTAADAALMPKIVSPNIAPVFQATFGAHNYRLEGLEITSTAAHASNLLFLGYEGRYPDIVSEFVRDITIDRSYIHGTPTTQITHAINATGANITLSNSEVSDIKRLGFDSQAFFSGKGLSGYTIENNFLEAAGENIMFGGLGFPIADEFIPQDIVIRGNSISKPNTWKVGHPDYAGTEWTVKNLVEFKLGKNIVVEDNVIENIWSQSQQGYAFVITPRSGDVDNLVIRNNIIRDVRSLAVMSPQYHALSNVVFENNLAYNIEENLFLLLSFEGEKTDGVTIRNNTALFGENATNGGLGDTNLSFGDNEVAVSNLIYQDNVLGGGLYAIHGTGRSIGLDSVLFYAQGFDIRGNQVLVPNQSGLEAYAIGDPYDQNGDYYGDFNLWGNAADMGFADLAWSSPEHFDLSGNPAFTGKGADIGALLDAVDLPPAVSAVAANGLAERTVSKPTSSVNGLTNLEIKFSRPVVFTAADVSVHAVTFPGGVESVGAPVTIQSISGSTTDTMTLTFAAGDIVDTWVKVVLHDSIVDLNGVALDGDVPATGRGRDYIYDGDADLPTGNHVAGGDVVFYTGNLVGDANGDGITDISDILIAFANSTGPNPDPPAPTYGKTEIEGDADQDEDVDTTDLITLFANNGNSLDALPTLLASPLSLLGVMNVEEADDPNLTTSPTLSPITQQERQKNFDAIFAQFSSVAPSSIQSLTTLPDDTLVSHFDDDEEDRPTAGDIDSASMDLLFSLLHLFSESDEDDDLMPTESAL